MAFIFDGREFARKKEEELAKKVAGLKQKPKLDSIIVGDDPASILYQNLKKKAAERIGAEVRIKIYPSSISKDELIKEIQKLNKYSSVNGIMIQLPLPENFSEKYRDEIINAISPEKDVDGLRLDSKFIPPTAKAVLDIFSEAKKKVNLKSDLEIVVVGGSGFIGGQIVKAFKELKNPNYKIKSVGRKTLDLNATVNADVLISVTGVEGLITEEMVKTGSVLIDVGAPKGDIDKSAYNKADFVSPVPGGVGPVTVSGLLENLVFSSI